MFETLAETVIQINLTPSNMKNIKAIILQKTDATENVDFTQLAFDASQQLTYHNICAWNSNKLLQCLKVKITKHNICIRVNVSFL